MQIITLLKEMSKEYTEGEEEVNVEVERMRRGIRKQKIKAEKNEPSKLKMERVRGELMMNRTG